MLCTNATLMEEQKVNKGQRQIFFFTRSIFLLLNAYMKSNNFIFLLKNK